MNDNGWPYASEELRLIAHAQDAILRDVKKWLAFVAILLIAALLIYSAVAN